MMRSEIEIGQRRSEKDEKVEVSFDGDDAVHLGSGRPHRDPQSKNQYADFETEQDKFS